jgi:hypothetical protein
MITSPKATIPGKTRHEMQVYFNAYLFDHLLQNKVAGGFMSFLNRSLSHFLRNLKFDVSTVKYLK